MTTMTKTLTLGVAALATVASLLTGCASEKPEAAPTSTSSGNELIPMSETPGAAFECPAPGEFTSPEIKTALQSAPLPPGVVVVNEQDLYNVDDRSKIDVVVRVCNVSLAGDPLKDVATTVASAIKQSPVGETVQSLRVSNTALDGNPRAKVRVEDFQMFLFAPDAVCCVNRAAWKYPDEQ